MIKKVKFNLIPVIIGIFWFLSALSSAAATADSADAIAVRVVPNPEHYSIGRWYASQGFSGSPQALVVDGYEAIRDGRTVYVNAANIDPNTKTIYTNIYLISYNQDPAPNTVDILGQIVSHWKFNSNLEEGSGAKPTCSISSVSCTGDTDCGAEQICGTAAAGIASSSCLLKTSKNCLVDSDCPTNFFCDSVKAKITRDVKRLGQLEDLKELLFNFKNVNNHYPLLTAGTYLPGNSVSVWPSWSQALLSDLNAKQNFIDPINRLGACSGYDSKTCWNENTRRFVNAPSAANLALPTGSYAFAYSVDANGSQYNLCGVLESREAALNYRFSPNDPAGSACVTATGITSDGQAANTAPQLVDKLLVGEAAREFNGFIKVKDVENNSLSWTITKSGSWSGWQGGPVLQDTSNPDQKKIYATKTGNPGTYNLQLTVSDNQGGVLTTSTPITILGLAPFVEAENVEYVLNPQEPFNYSFFFSGSNQSVPQNSYTVTPTAGPFNLLTAPSISKVFSVAGENRYKVEYRGLISTTAALTTEFYQDTDFAYQIKVNNNYRASTTKNFSIKIKVNNPSLNFNCSEAARLNQPYVCEIGPTKQGDDLITYSSPSGLPPGLSLVDDASVKFLRGVPTAKTPGRTISIKAKNQYGASTTKEFILKVNTFCGDGIKQLNTEGGGGIYNDGDEDCDINSGVAGTVGDSNVAKQYGCQTVDADTPNPIPNNNYCVFKSPLEGGGYCGDGYCQCLANPKTGACTWENCKNCNTDCASCTATIASYAKEEQVAYFNGNQIYKTGKSGVLGEANVTIANGDNVFAFWAHTLSASNYGLAFRLLLGPKNAPYDVVDSSNFALKCAVDPEHTFDTADGLSGSDYDPANELVRSNYNWTQVDFPESTDFASSTLTDKLSVLPKITVTTGKVTGSLPYAWHPNSSQLGLYCRLNYYYDYDQLGRCRPACEGKECGPDGCGNTCGPACSVRYPAYTAAYTQCKASTDYLCVCTPSCVGKCVGEGDGCGGTCPINSTGTNNVCSSSSEVKTCWSVLGWPSGSYTGDAPCNDTCSGYDTSQCQPDMSYWYKVPESEESHLIAGVTECAVKFDVDANNRILCRHFPSPVTATAQWFKGVITEPDTVKICSVPGCSEMVNPNKCRWTSIPEPNWTGYCYVHKTW
ncbi:TPA: hypothetical protein DCZ15_01695 [Candidatus Falkowbacteria bacterium]|nr:MAG: hypothetical protein UV95_C0004G0002 [Candidatus Falkowbacteria bacterium GW2011_GWF2_43_32]HBA36570.1 hypothetical protein [Candidatus Falkowbacteria bacterium]